jgi:hypothetical protein
MFGVECKGGSKMADSERENDLPVEVPNGSDSKLNVATEEMRQGAEQLLGKQQELNTAQKNMDRPPTILSQKFGRIELLDDDGSQLTKPFVPDIANISDDELKEKPQKSGEDDSLGAMAMDKRFPTEARRLEAYKTFLAKELSGQPLSESDTMVAGALKKYYADSEDKYRGFEERIKKGEKLSEEDQTAMHRLEPIHKFNDEYGTKLRDLYDKKDPTPQEQRFIKVLESYPSIYNNAWIPVPEVM